VAELETDSALLRQIDDLREQQRAVSGVLRAVVRSEGLQPVLDVIVESATRLCQGDHARMYLLEDGRLQAFANYGATEGYDYDREHPHALDRTTMAGRAALTRAPVHLPDVLADPEYSYSGSTAAFRAGIAVPILLDNELIGALAVVRVAVGPFANEHIELLETFADQAAIAISSARLLDAFRRQLEQQQAVSDVLRAVARREGLQPVLDEVVEEATRLSGGESGRLWLVRDGAMHAFANYGSTQGYEYEKEHPIAPDRTTMTGRVALTREVVQIPDITLDLEYAYAGPTSFRAGLTVPILLEDELIGAIGVIRTEPGLFADDQIELVKTFADQAAIAIANARLIEAVESQLEQQQAISQVLRGVARFEGLDAVLHVVVEAAARLCGAEYGEVHLLEGDRLHLAVGHGGPPELYEYERAHPHVIARTTVSGRVALLREVVHIPDILEDPEFDWSIATDAGVRTLLGAPLLVEGNLVGVFNIVRTDPVPFSDEQINLLRTFADQAAIAIANARLLEAVERQRTELSRFVSPQVAELVSSEGGEKMLTGHRGYVTILFCDLRGFTAFTETAEPEELFEVLRDYHAAVGRLIPQYGGTLEHFQGDGLMVFFNDPLPVENHELKAIRLALAAQEGVRELAAAWRKRGIDLGLGIGMAAGYATLGRVGFEGRYDYGALGAVTNLAARLTAHALPGQTLIDQRVFAAVEDEVEAEPVGELELKGLGRPVVAYAVSGVRA
jgi:GAF domain-containing protein